MHNIGCTKFFVIFLFYGRFLPNLIVLRLPCLNSNVQDHPKMTPSSLVGGAINIKQGGARECDGWKREKQC